MKEVILKNWKNKRCEGECDSEGVGVMDIKLEWKIR